MCNIFSFFQFNSILFVANFLFVGNIICDSPELRDEIIKQKILPKMFSLIKPSMPSTLLKRISWFFVNLCCCHSITPVAYDTLVELLPILNKMIKMDDVDVIIKNSYKLFYINCDSILMRLMAVFISVYIRKHDN